MWPCYTAKVRIVIIIMLILLSLVASQIVMTTSYGVTSDDKVDIQRYDGTASSSFRGYIMILCFIFTHWCVVFALYICSLPNAIFVRFLGWRVLTISAAQGARDEQLYWDNVTGSIPNELELQVHNLQLHTYSSGRRTLLIYCTACFQTPTGQFWDF